MASATAQLPPGCVNLVTEPLSMQDPMEIFPENRELEEVAPPRRIGSWGATKVLPTQHYAINQAKDGGEPAVKLEPYTSIGHFIFKI